MERGRVVGGPRVESASDGSGYANTARGLICRHARSRGFENRKPRDYAGRAARQNSAESAAITAATSRSLLLRVKSSKRLSFVKSHC